MRSQQVVACVHIFLVFLSYYITLSQGHDEEDREEIGEDVSGVTCGSVIKLRHVATGYRLHSHSIPYGSGSGQQSVTGFPEIDDPNSYWVVRGPHMKHCPRGTPVKNGDIIRLQHLNTGKNLHSHLHPSPLTRQQEVSAFGNEAVGDTGDNWKVVLTETEWKRGETMKLQHVDTKQFLSSNKSKFNNPIPGQQEVCAIQKATKDAEWAAEEGFYFPAIKK